MVSPRGERYAEVRLRRETPSSAAIVPPSADPALQPDELQEAFREAPALLARRARFLAAYGTSAGGDPWYACDVMDLICDWQPHLRGEMVPCRRLQGCDS